MPVTGPRQWRVNRYSLLNLALMYDPNPNTSNLGTYNTKLNERQKTTT